jgi:RNA polymerase sigma-70 factor (ECF subfamily)
VLHRDVGEADEVFSLFTEARWRSLSGRESRCAHRTWAYAVARRASLGYRRAERHFQALKEKLHHGPRSRSSAAHQAT